MRVWEVIHNVIDVQREEGAAERAASRYPFLGGHCSVRENIRYPSVHVAMYACISISSL